VSASAAEYPAVTAIVPTRDRPELLRRAVDAVRAQDYPGDVHCLVVYDGTEPDFSLCREGRRSVLVGSNTRKPGLAGARNTGIILTQTELVAFCDDDDAWLPGKLTAQAERLAEAPDATLVACGIRIEYGDRTVDRSLDATELTLDDLLRSRLVELHSSSFLFRRQRLVDLGMVDEDVPGSFGEDYELLLRIARQGPIANVPDVHLLVRWHEASHFVRDWDTMATALGWLLDEYPELRRTAEGEARIAGQIAFAHAALGDRRTALQWARRTVRRNPKQARAYLALAIASGLVKPDTVLRRLHERGHSI
jgi:glycosyltransferase involved in cell wall biosynthesis